MARLSWVLLLALAVLVTATSGPQCAEAKGFRQAVKRFFGSLLGRKPKEDKAQVPSEPKPEDVQGQVNVPIIDPVREVAGSADQKPSHSLLYGDLGRYNSEDTVADLEAGFHIFTANFYQGQLMMRGAVSRVATAIKRVVLPVSGPHAANLRYIRQRTVNLFFDSRNLFLRCLYIAYFPIPAPEPWDVKDIAYRRRKLVHFLGTYYMLNVRLTLLVRIMRALLSTMAEVMAGQAKESRRAAAGQQLQISCLYLMDGFQLLRDTLDGLKEAVVASLVFPFPRERAYRALHRTGLLSHQILKIAQTTVEATAQLRQAQLGYGGDSG
ncbi:transmembrane protein [Cystoisospora suis]|uniref:Transmembrane protein n=1 Tax=Cystoisospora suis TaxID=483139 RepID=A0A2C6LGN3_9APIC|nr:transmembrane protein [Cystoisospora suis]